MKKITISLMVCALILGCGSIFSDVAFAQMYDYGDQQPAKNAPPSCDQVPPPGFGPYLVGPHGRIVPFRYYGPRYGRWSRYNTLWGPDPLIAITGGL